MNPELLQKIKSYKLDGTTNRNTISSFLSGCISHDLYSEIEGDTHSEKTTTICNYLINGDLESQEPKVKQSLNIVIADDSSSLEYVSYLNQRFNVIVHKKKDVKNVKDIDLVLFTGGEDVNPERYYESVGKYTQINKSRDEKEVDTFHTFSGKCLMLGVCRGNQLLTVLSGGRLIQHVNGHGRDHSIIKSGIRYNMTSSHHQMIYPYDLNKRDYDLIAYSEYFLSDTYLNGNNDEIKLSNNFLEPEIVYYKNTDSLCIQGHPEWSHCDPKTSYMCLVLIEKYLRDFKNNTKSSSSYLDSLGAYKAEAADFAGIASSDY